MCYLIFDVTGEPKLLGSYSEEQFWTELEKLDHLGKKHAYYRFDGEMHELFRDRWIPLEHQRDD